MPLLEGEENTAPLTVPEGPRGEVAWDTYNSADAPVPAGYSMMGRLYAVGYMRGLNESVQAAAR